MRSRVWMGGTVAGIVGIALALFSLLPPLGESILLGSSIGLIVVGPIGGLAMQARTVTVQPSRDEKLRELVAARERKEKAEHEEVLLSFDRLLARVEKIDNPEVNDRVARNFDKFMRRLTSHYPEWDSEGRLRTYVLMNKVARRLNRQNAEAYLNMVYTTLVARGSEATAMSNISLNGKVERMYRDPGEREAHHLAGTLLLMNRADEVYAKGLVADAMHLWSEERFDRFLPDFMAVKELSEKARREVEGMIAKDMAKARAVGDVSVVMRGREIMRAIIRDRRVQNAPPA